MRRAAPFPLPALGAMLLAAVTLGHEVIYLLAHGPGEGYARAMAEGGHDRYWTSFMLTVAAVSGGLMLAAGTQLVRLHRQARAARSCSIEVRDRGRRPLFAIAGRLWLRLAALALAVYVFQENIEMMSVGGGLPLHGVLLAEHGIALLVLPLVSLLVAFVAALFAWRREVYLAAIRGAAGRPRHVELLVRRPTSGVGRPLTDAAGRRNGVRAPPIGVLAPA